MSKADYYGVNGLTLLFCEHKNGQHRGVNDRRGPQGTGIWMPTRDTWYECSARQGTWLKPGYYVALTKATASGRNYTVEAYRQLDWPLADVQRWSKDNDAKQKYRLENNIQACDDEDFIVTCVELGLFGHPDKLKKQQEFDEVIALVQSGDITTRELIQVLRELREQL